jgi:uncharacterized protein (DUF302 family)
MDKTRYGIGIELRLDFESAIERTIERLKDHGFGVLTDIDVKETLKQKLGVDFKNYRILGACNPPLAHKALTAEDEIGLLLPCNVIVYETSEGKVRVSAIDPVAAMSVVGNDTIKPVAEEVSRKLTAVISALAEPAKG